MGNEKDYINYDLKFRKCLNCFRSLPFDNFYLLDSVRKGLRPSSYCKKCCSEVDRERYLKKKLKLFPKFYSDCDECGLIFKNSLGHDCKGEE